MAKIASGKPEFNKYEKARLIGARALQISQGSPFFIKLSKKELENIGYNTLEIAKLEFKKGLIPIGVKATLPHERRAKDQAAVTPSVGKQLETEE